MVGNEIGKYLYALPEFVAAPQIEGVEKLFRSKVDGQFYFMDKNRTFKPVASVKFKTIAGLLNQNGVDAPTFNSFDNDSGFTIQSVYKGVGYYNLIVNEMVENQEKLLILTQSSSNVSGGKFSTVNLSNNIDFQTIAVNSYLDYTAANSVISNMTFKISIYKIIV